jgi:hypothetical protein
VAGDFGAMLENPEAMLKGRPAQAF